MKAVRIVAAWGGALLWLFTARQVLDKSYHLSQLDRISLAVGCALGAGYILGVLPCGRPHRENE